MKTRKESDSNDLSVQTKAAGTPGRSSLAQKRYGGAAEQTPVEVQAKGDIAAGPGSVQSTAAHGVQDAGGSLPHLEAIQASFGTHDVSGVQAHVGGRAGEATATMGAEAYATGNHVAFNSAPSLHTAAHEAAHVVQQRAGVQLKGGVGEVGEEYEQHADQVADAVVAGEPAEALLDAHAGNATNDVGVQMLSDGVDKLNDSAESHWYKSTDGAKVVANFKALTPAERDKMVRDDGFDKIMRRVVKALDAFQMTQLFALVPRDVADLRWKLYWLDAGGQISKMSIAQWRWFLVYNDPSDWTKLRAYPTGYKMFLEHCPAELVPPWDLLQGLETKQWKGTSAAVRTAVNQLNPAQKVKVLGDKPKLEAIVSHAGNAHETYRTLSYLNADITTMCTHLGFWRFRGLTNDDWGAMFGAAPRAEVDALAKNQPAIWAQVTGACPPSIISVVRGATQEVDDGTGTGTKEAAVDKQLDDPIMVAAMLKTMGATGFLSLCCTTGADAAANYQKVRTALNVAGVTSLVKALQPGQRMGDRTAAHLKLWFLAETASPSLSEAMMSQRFNMTVGGTGAYNHNGATTTITQWTIPALHQSWIVLERLPPSNVENNPRLMNMLRNGHATGGDDGAAYYGSLINDPNYKSGEVVMGYKNLAAPRTDANAGPGVYSANGQGAGAAAVPMNLFNATLRHEIGHSVDRQLGIMDGWGAQDSAGAWKKHPTYEAFIDAIISAGGGFGTKTSPKHGYIGADIDKYRAAMIKAVKTGVSFQAALTSIKATAGIAPDAGCISAVFTTARWTGGGSGPWYQTANYKPQNDRSFQRAYDDADSLYSFKDSIRTSKGVTQYQWRAPGEWFAEVYQVYYAEQETGANTPVGGILRSKDKNAAELMSTVVDRGFSPQDMRGGKTEKAPGT